MRLNIERQKELEPKRIEFTKSEIEKCGLHIINETTRMVQFYFKEELVTFYPYSGWHTGKSIKDGRGFEKLLKQLTA